MSSRIPTVTQPVPSASEPGNPGGDIFAAAREAQREFPDVWALSLDPETATPEDLRAGAYAIMESGFGLRSPDGRLFSGERHEALTPQEHYAKAMECFREGTLRPLETSGWREYHDAAEKGDRATMRRLARENVRGEGVGDDVGAAWDRETALIGSNDFSGNFQFNAAHDQAMRDALASVRDTLSPEEAAAVDEWFGTEQAAGLASLHNDFFAAEAQFAGRRRELEAQIRDLGASGADTWRQDQELAELQSEYDRRLHEQAGRVDRTREMRGRISEIYRRHADDIRDEQRLPAYERQLADDNLWATVSGLRGAVSDRAWRVVEMAQDSARNPTQKRVLDEFEKLSTTEQRSIAGALHALHYGRDTYLLGDAFRAFWDTAAQTVGGSARAIADVFRRGVMDGEEYRDMVERRALLEQANSERMKEWGYFGTSVIGAFSTIPYMAVAAIPHAGTAAIMASASDQFQSEAALNGVDVGSREFMLTNWAFSGAYAAVEKLQVIPFKPLKNVSRRQMYCEMFHSIRGALFVSGGIAGTTVSESVEEGLQGGIERVVEGWGLGHDQAKEFAKGFASDFVDSLGTMAIIGTASAGVQRHRYRHGAFSGEEAVAALGRVKDISDRITGHPDDAAAPLGEFSREYGLVGRDWVNAGTDVGDRIRAIRRWGFTPDQAVELNQMFSEIWKGVSGNEEAMGEFVGGNRVRSAAELLADTLGVQVEDGDGGEKSVSFRIGRGRVKLRFNPADRIETEVDVNDRRQAADVVEILNRIEEATTGTRGTMTVNEWLDLPEEVRREQTKGMTVQGVFKIDAPDGTSVGEDALRVLSGRVVMTDAALPQTAFHESMHAVLRLLREEAATDPEAKALQEELAKVYAPQEGIDETVNEEVLADGYQAYLTSLTTAVEDTGVFARLKRWIARLLGRATVARDSLRAAQSAQGRLFNLALTGDLTPAMRKEGTKPEEPSSGEQGTKPVENPATAEPAAARYQVASAPSAAELAEVQRQYDEVVARYTNPDGTRKPGWLKAPNGADTHLTERQWVQVRTPAFKAWFGDWENDPANASKVVDENGEPRVMWRGAPFDPLSQEPGKGVIAAERYFTPNEAYARRYEKGAGATRAYFLNMRSPFDVRNARDAARMLELREGHAFHAGSTGALDWAEAPTAEEIEERWPGGYDGLVLDEGGDPAESGPAHRGESVVLFAGGAQVKSATDNVGTFSGENQDIRYSVTPAEDAAYMDAVRRGDMETAQRMVLEAAEKTGLFDTDIYGKLAFLYHGGGKKHSRLTGSRRGVFGGFYTSPDEDTARIYADFDGIVQGIQQTEDAYLEYYDEEKPPRQGVVERIFQPMNLFDADEFSLDQFSVDDILEAARGTDYWRLDDVVGDAIDNGEDPHEAVRDYILNHPPFLDEDTDALSNAPEFGFAIMTGLVDVDDIMRTHGGIEYKDAETGTRTVVVPNNLAKSADPVTYDDAGNVIPLSQRFNPENEDIRYQVAARQTDTAQFKRWFGKSKIVDASGNPLVCAHRTPNDFEAFDIDRSTDLEGREVGLGWGAGKIYLIASERENFLPFREGQRVLKLYVRSENPIDGGEYNRRLDEKIESNPKANPESPDYDMAERDRLIAELDAEIKAEGHDGIWDRTTGELAVFDPKQVKHATENIGTFGENDPRFRYQISGPVGAEALGIRNLPDAEAMERSGADRLAIWRETGWWRGRDGEWRVEIPDFELVPDAVRLLLANGSARLADLIPADSAILRAYPSLGKMRIDVVDGLGSRAAYHGIKIEVDRGEIGTPRYLLSDLRHEVQHAVQSIEGFSQGGNATMRTETGRRIGSGGYHRLAGEVEARNVTMRAEMSEQERRAFPPWETEDVAESVQIVQNVEQSLPKTVRESPSYDGIDADTDAPRFSIATYENGGRETLEKWLASQTKGKNATLSKEDAAQILAETDFIADVARSLARKKKRFAAFSNWSEARVELDSEGRPYFGVVRTNGDYAMNIDFSTVCKKRRPMDRIFSRLVRDGILTGANVNELSGEAVAGIQRIIKAHGLEVACALCFVDAKRYRLGDVAKRFADGGTTGEGKYFPGWNSIVEAQAKGGKKWKDRVKAAKGKKDFESRCVRAIENDPALRVRVDGSQLVSSEGMDAFARERPGIYELWTSYGGTSHAKDSHWDAPYNNDIIRPFASRTNDKKRAFDRARAYAIGGVRLQSFSDFVGRMFFDYAQMFAELAGKRLPLHTYTKEPNFVKIFHRTRAKINMSLVPAVVDGGVAPGLDAKGNYVWADECFPPDEAFALRSLGSNVGTIAVGVSGKHIRKLLRDPRIDMVIPYHASGINPAVANIRRIDEFFDYTSEQNTRNADGSKYKGKEHFDFYGSLAKTRDPKATANEYLEWCDKRGLLPKFDKFRDEENYYKLLADFRLYDDAGNYAPQEDVRQEYPEDLGRLVEEAVAHDQEAEDTFAAEEDAIVAEIEASILGPRVAEAERAAGDAARASVVWNGPAYSYKSFATAYAARDRILGIDRPDDDYRRLLETMGVRDYSVDDLKADAERIRARGLGRNEATLQRLAGLAEQASMARTVESLMRGSLELGEDVGSSARRAYEAYLARMRRTAKGRDYTDLTADLGFDLADLALAIDPETFAPKPKPEGDAAPPESGGSDAETGAVADEDPEVAALLDGKAADFGLTEEQLRERIRDRMEQRTQEIRERLERIRARLDEWRAKEARRKAKLAERQEAEGKSDAPADLTDAEMFDAEGNETEAGAKRLADYENECVEEMPDFKAFLEECRRNGLDLSDAAEFVAAVRIWSEDFIARETGADPEKVLRDPVNLARYRATMMEFLHGMADAMLDPEDGAAAKTAERMMQEIPSDATVGEIDGRARTIVGFIQRNGIRQSSKQLIRELRKGIRLEAIRGKKWDEMERDAGRKVTGEREAAARYLYRILTWSDGMIAKESARLHDIVAGREDAYRSAGADDAALKDLARTDREVHRAAEKLQALQMYGGLRKKSPAEIKLAARAIMSWLTEEREAHEKRWNDWHARLDALAQRAARAASASAQDYTPEDPGYVGKLADELTATIRQRLERLFVGGGADARAVIDEVMRIVYAGSERMRAETAAARRRTDEMLARCVQGTGRKVRQFLKDLDAPIPDELNRQLRTAEQPVRMTNGQALQLLASLEQVASYAGNIEANGRGAERVVGTDPDGNPVTEPQTPHAELLRRYFADKPAMVRLLEGMREVYEERRGALSDTFRAVTGNPILAPDPLYAPVKMFRGSSEGFETQVRAWDPFGPALQPRIKNTLDFDLSASIMDVYNNRTRETCRAIAWGIPGMELRSVLCRKEVQDAIARTHGKFPLRQLVAHLTDLVSDGWADEPSGFKWLAQKLGGATTYSALSWNVVTALKQTASIPAWTALMDGGYAEVFRNIANFDRAAARELMDAPGFAARYGSTSFGRMFKDAIRDPNANPLQRFFQAGMTAVQMGDFVPGILVGTGVYKAKKLALMRQGLEERQAREEAARIAWGLIEECQQSSRLENSPAFLRRGGFLARQAAKFASSPLLQVSHEVHTLRMWTAEAKAEARRNGGGVRMMSDSEDVARWRRRFVNQLICNHVLMPVAFYGIATMFNIALGSEPPDEEEVLGDLAMQTIVGPFGRIFLLGMIFDKGGEAVARAMGGKPNVYDSTGLAAQQYIQKIVGQLGRIGGDVADADWESVRDDLLKMLGQVSAPARYAVKIGQNAAGYDPAEARRERKAEIRRERGE